MAEQADKGSILDQAAADGSITDARHRAVDPVPIVVADVTDGVDLATLESADGVPSAPIWRVRRKLSPRPVPGNRRRKPPVPAPVTDEEPIPAEEMDDVGTQPDKAAKTADAEKAVTPDVEAEETPATATSAEASSARGTTATATKPAKPKTAAEIVAEQKAREKAAAESPQDDTAVTKPVTRQPAAPSAAAVPGATTPKTGVKPVAAAAKKTATSSSGSGKAALSAVGSGVKRFRNLLASLVWLIAVIAAALLALGALFTALDQANQSNEIVKWVLERGHDLVGPFKDLFRLETAKNTLLVNWGIAALVYLIIGKIAERFIRP
ncbi:hypothetical protein GCM10009554_02110 [Kribbella koreensis]|uniref:Uncharacterized protein n=2 Tax=Kribbella TaxID=182639 RepID=A0ABP6XC30_9ACTN